VKAKYVCYTHAPLLIQTNIFLFSIYQYVKQIHLPKHQTVGWINSLFWLRFL